MTKVRYGTHKKYHFIYKTTNTLSGRYYIGMHSTDNLNDGYLGSGKLLKLSINKHGIENHAIEILEFVSSREELAKREAEIITLQEIAKKECMNLRIGGNGGFAYEEDKNKWVTAGLNAIRNLEKTNPGWLAERSLRQSIGNKLAYKEGRRTTCLPNWLGKRHSIETKQKIGQKNSIKQQGNGNSQFGTMWITNGFENKKISNLDEIPIGFARGRKILKS